jgi:hypothetical protein
MDSSAVETDQDLESNALLNIKMRPDIFILSLFFMGTGVAASYEATCSDCTIYVPSGVMRCRRCTRMDGSESQNPQLDLGDCFANINGVLVFQRG